MSYKPGCYRNCCEVYMLWRLVSILYVIKVDWGLLKKARGKKKRFKLPGVMPPRCNGNIVLAPKITITWLCTKAWCGHYLAWLSCPFQHKSSQAPFVQLINWCTTGQSNHRLWEMNVSAAVPRNHQYVIRTNLLYYRATNESIGSRSTRRNRIWMLWSKVSVREIMLTLYFIW